MKKLAPETYKKIEELLKNDTVSKQIRIAEELSEQHPDWSPVTCLTIAGDRVSAEKAALAVKNGLPVEDALHLVGSFSKIEWIYERWQDGSLPEARAFQLLVEWWPYSDPDDTDMRFREFWGAAWYANGRKILGSHLPGKPNEAVLLWRGQDDGAPLGLSWTSDLRIARKFARGAALRMASRPGVILEGLVPKNKIMAYLTSRNEEEHIVDPNYMEQVKVVQRAEVKNGLQGFTRSGSEG